MRHVLTLNDLATSEIRRILEIASDLKRLLENGNRPPVLERKVLGLLFEKPSLRTRVSFESLMHQAGGASLFLGEDVGWRSREPMKDFVPILSSYLDCLVIRARRHRDVVAASELSRCPVINGLTEIAHPCQALADLMTVKQIFGSLDGLKIAYIGDANNVAFSLGLLCNKLGIRFSIAAPEKYQFDASRAAQISAANRDLFTQMTDPRAAVADATVVYTDVWTSMGQEAENEQRLRDFAEFQVNEQLFSAAAADARFFHCLPARRGEEVTAAVIDGDRSAIIQQAENRLHAQKGLVVWLLTESSK